MSQSKVHHHRAGVDAEIGPHDGTPEFVETPERTKRRAHGAIPGDPEEEYDAGCAEDSCHQQTETFDRARQAVVLLGVSHLEPE